MIMEAELHVVQQHHTFSYNGFVKHFASNLDHYKKMYDAVAPHEVPLP
jgi:hypothetical protein